MAGQRIDIKSLRARDATSPDRHQPSGVNPLPFPCVLAACSLVLRFPLRLTTSSRAGFLNWYRSCPDMRREKMRDTEAFGLTVPFSLLARADAVE